MQKTDLTKFKELHSKDRGPLEKARDKILDVAKQFLRTHSIHPAVASLTNKDLLALYHDCNEKYFGGRLAREKIEVVWEKNLIRA